MFKDYRKYLTTTLKVYLFVLVTIFILKIVGLNYFGLELNNPTMISFEKMFSNYYLRIMLYLFLLMSYQYLMLSIIFKDNSKRFIIFILLTTPFTYLIHRIKNVLIEYELFTFIMELLYLIILICIYNYKYRILSTKEMFKRFFMVIVLNMLFQMISMLTRFKYSINYINEFIPNIILNLDYLFLLLITQRLAISKKGVEIECYQVEVGSSSQKKTSLKQSLQKLQKSYQNNLKKFKKKSKEEKLSIIIYLILSLIWNSMTVVLVLFVAFLNHTLIECIFILTSFWLSKRAFGPAFHFNSMLKCFIVSNISYYILNRITTPLGISIMVPILLGVGLSYVTSKFVKKTYKPLHRGMSKELFEETILKVEEKNTIKYKICYEFYIERASDLSLSFKYNYSVAGIRKIKDRINKKIKELNKEN